MRVTKLATRFFLLIEVFLVLLDQLLAFRTNFPQEYKCSQTSGRKYPISWGLGRCGEFSYLLVLHVSPIKIIPNCSGPLACFKDLSRPWEDYHRILGGGDGVVIFLSCCFTLLQSRYARAVQALWLVLTTFLVHGVDYHPFH